MKIELLYFDGCPNHEQALENLRNVMEELGIEEKIEAINIIDNDDAVAKRFLGSPSIRIDGRDLEYAENDNTEYSMRCRRYKSETGIQGYPSIALIKVAVQAANTSGVDNV